MLIDLISVGQKMPAWVDSGYQEYARRMPKECRLQLTEIAAGKRGKNADIERITRDEGERMLKVLPKKTQVCVLDVKGKPWSTEQLARQLSSWMQDGRDMALLVGGPEGLADSCLQRADIKWSLSSLTFPHPLVRIIVAEQIYRAWSLLNNHPYHRAG